MRYLFFMLLCFLILITFGSSKKTPEHPTPPNCVQIKDSLWMDETEIANIHWLEYLYYLKNDSSDTQYRAALPDTTVWNNSDLGYNDAYFEHYLRYPGFRYFPVVGITPIQATNFCKWRSAIVNYKYKTNPKTLKRKYRNWDFTVEFRLPTRVEWDTLSKGMKVEKVVSKYRFSKNDTLWNSNRKRPEDTVSNNYSSRFLNSYYVTDYIYNYPPNKWGVYNLDGNVSEIIEGNVVAGANYDTWYDINNAEVIQPFEKPTSKIGFRCSCITTLNPKSDTVTEPRIDPVVDTHEVIVIQEVIDNYIDDCDMSNELNQVQLFPNPTSNLICIELTDWKCTEVNVSLLDPLGNELLNIILSTTEAHSIDVSDYKSGYYTLSITDGITTKLERVLVEY